MSKVRRIAKLIQPLLPPDQKIQRLLPFPMPGHTLWAVLSCTERKDENNLTEHKSAQCSVFEVRQGLHPTRIWKSRVVASEDDRPLMDPNLWAWSMTGHKTPELVFYSGILSGSWNLSTMQIYRWRKGTFQAIFDDENSCSHWIVRRPHTSVYQVRSLDMIGGVEIGHSGLIHWPEIYDWNGSQYVQANEKHPKEFQEAKADLLDKLKLFPDNPELWQYLGYAYLYNHQRRSALAAFQKAERYFRVMLQDKDEREYALQGLRELKEITRNRREAVH